jgi:hypothetical protein
MAPASASVSTPGWYGATPESDTTTTSRYANRSADSSADGGLSALHVRATLAAACVTFAVVAFTATSVSARHGTARLAVQADGETAVASVTRESTRTQPHLAPIVRDSVAEATPALSIGSGGWHDRQSCDNTGVITLHYVHGMYSTTFVKKYFEHLWAKVNDTSLNMTYAPYSTKEHLEGAATNGTFCAGDAVILESWASCNYIYTESNPLFLSDFAYFRTVLNYSKPLQIFWNDASCRLEMEATTHHKIYRTGTPNNLTAAVGNLPVPWGLETYCNSDTGYQTKRIVNRSLAFNVRAATMFRRPNRVELARALTNAEESGALRKAVATSYLGSSGAAWNGTGYLIDMPAMTKFENYSYETESSWPDYCAMLESSIFTLIPGGDDYWDTRYAEAILAGSIPVVYSGARYKQCHKPADNNFKAVNAPFLYIDNWEEFPHHLEKAMALGLDGLQAWQDSLYAWYDDYTSSIHESITSTHATMMREYETDTFERTTCTNVEYVWDTTDQAALFMAYQSKLASQLAGEKAEVARRRTAGLTDSSAPGGLSLHQVHHGLRNDTFVKTDGNTSACGTGSEWKTCDDAYMSSCSCRYGDSDTFYGTDAWCDFGTCFSSDCVVHDVKNWSCAIMPR